MAVKNKTAENQAAGVPAPEKANDNKTANQPAEGKESAGAENVNVEEGAPGVATPEAEQIAEQLNKAMQGSTHRKHVFIAPNGDWFFDERQAKRRFAEYSRKVNPYYEAPQEERPKLKNLKKAK
jgi:hypothetical protein